MKEIPEAQQEIIRQAIIEIVKGQYIMDCNFTAGAEELEPEGDTRRFKPNGILEIYVKLQLKPTGGEK